MRDASLAQSTLSIEINNNTYSNTSFESYVCTNDNINTVTMISILVDASVTGWFRIPQCVSSWTALKIIDCSGCQLPNFTALPTALTQIHIVDGRGTWSEVDAGAMTESLSSHYFDWTWLSRFPDLQTLDLISSNINGTIPSSLSHPLITEFNVNSNNFAGTVPPSFFLNFPNMASFTASLNQFTGSIPNYGLSTLSEFDLSDNLFTHWPPLLVNDTPGFTAPTSLKTITINNNRLVQIPTEYDFQGMSSLSSFNIFGNTNLSGPFPNLFATFTPRSGSNILFNIQASECNFSGPLPEIPSDQIDVYVAAPQTVELHFYSNDFSGTFPTSWHDLPGATIDISFNPALNGTLATIDANGRVISQFMADAFDLSIGPSAFTGPMFNISTMVNLRTLSLRADGLDLCATARSLSSDKQGTIQFPEPDYLTNCDISSSNSNQCGWAYPSRCVVGSPASLVPFSAPVAPVNPPVSSPVSTSIPVGTAPPRSAIPTDRLPIAPTCRKPKPGPTFTCSGTTWISPGSVTQKVIELPPATSTVVNGDLNTSSIVLSSASSSLTVTGCISSGNGSLPSITLTVTQDDLDEIVKKGGKLTTLLLEQDASCETLASVALVVDTKSVKSCKTVKADKITSSSSLSAAFTINSSKCNVWWIILVSVLCGLVLIAVIVVVVLVACSKKAREKILPYSKRRERQRSKLVTSE